MDALWSRILSFMSSDWNAMLLLFTSVASVVGSWDTTEKYEFDFSSAFVQPWFGTIVSVVRNALVRSLNIYGDARTGYPVARFHKMQFHYAMSGFSLCILHAGFVIAAEEGGRWTICLVSTSLQPWFAFFVFT
jgi:hypothetical protein